MLSEYFKEEICTPPHMPRSKYRSCLYGTVKKQDYSPSINGTVAMNRQRLQVLFSDIENLLVVHKTRGVPQLRAAYHLEKVDAYLGQLDEVSYKQLLTAYSLNKVQKLKLDLELLACELVQYIA